MRRQVILYSASVAALLFSSLGAPEAEVIAAQSDASIPLEQEPQEVAQGETSVPLEQVSQEAAQERQRPGAERRPLPEIDPTAVPPPARRL